MTEAPVTPLKVEAEISLQDANSLQLGCHASQLVRVSSTEELLEACHYAREKQLRLLPLGEGSNVVLGSLNDYLLVRMQMRGIELREEAGSYVTVDVAAGENWHDWVMGSIERGWFGLENLALIPGSVGAAPIQNIGAYGVEAASFIEAVEVIDMRSSGAAGVEPHWFDGIDCAFAYRDSLFRRAAPGDFLVTRVRFRLSRQFSPVLDYPGVVEPFRRLSIAGSDIDRAQALAETVIALRQEKLPDPLVEPNAGSFFKNIIVGTDEAQDLQREWPDMPTFSAPDSARVKIPAAWLIEQSGCRALSSQYFSLSSKHALVVVHSDQQRRGSASELLEFAAAIRSTVVDRFGLTLEIEPICIGD